MATTESVCTFARWVQEQRILLTCSVPMVDHWALIDPVALLSDHPLAKHQRILSFIVLELAGRLRNYPSLQLSSGQRENLEDEVLKLARLWTRGVLDQATLLARTEYLASTLIKGVRRATAA